MRYEWDPAKAKRNQEDHEVAFADAVSIFTDDRALTIDDPRHSEERYFSIGMDLLGRVLVVVYTWRGRDAIRIISARKATPRERRQYAEGEL